MQVFKITSLEIQGKDISRDQFLKYVDSLDSEELRIPDEPEGFFHGGSDQSWDIEEQDAFMIGLSLRFPETLFIIGIEEYNDPARHYYLNGKCCSLFGEIIFPDFSQDMLKEPVG